jgi:DNA-binding LacI/PurR family transcriptional regulator
MEVPEEVKITGIDNSPLSEDCIVPITSVSWELNSTGMKTARLLLDRIAGKRVKSFVIEPKLIVRRSSGGPEDYETSLLD